MKTYHETTKNVYKDAALQPNVGLCCTTSPVWQLPDLKMPQIMLEMNYGCGTVVSPRDLVNNPQMLYVGIGGGIAEIVGRLMRKLGETAQVLCITHLPQVAAQGHHHLQVAKNRDKNSTSSQLVLLNPEQQVHEIARMLGGVKITPQTLAHAQEMLENSSLETT